MGLDATISDISDAYQQHLGVFITDFIAGLGLY